MAEGQYKAPQHAAGLYSGEVVAQRFGKSAEKGTPYMEVDFRITEKIDLADQNKTVAVPSPKVRSVTMWITEGTLQYVIPKLQVLGFTGNSFSQLDPEKPNHVSLKGRKCKLWCKHEKDQKDASKVYERFDIQTPYASKKENESGVAAELDSLFANQLTIANQNAPKQTPKTEAPKQESAATTADGDSAVPAADDF